jgi:hypothetical protein
LNAGGNILQIGVYLVGSCTYDTVYIKDNNAIAVSLGYGVNNCITIIDIEQYNAVQVKNSLRELYPWCLSFVLDSVVYFQLT